jgi:ABC-type multidrug transport system ATPase subunit
LIVGGKEKIYKIIENLKNEGYTIICITNLADEILIADRTLILKNGRIVNEIKKKELVDKSGILKENGIKEPILLEILNKLKKNEIVLNMEKITTDELVSKLKGKLNEKCN